MFYGRTGTDVRIDLSTGNVEKEEGNPEAYEAFLGGRGTCTKRFWDEVKPEVVPFSEDNPLIFGAGLLCGTMAPGANRTTLVTKSPQTGLLTYSVAGGFWAPELKRAGYDSLSIYGKSPTPVYLWINNGNVEIRDASRLWGKDTRETQRMIRQELDNDNVQTLCIGQAGENRVFSSSIEHGTGASFSRSAVGALMGDKKLKAIAVYGTNDVNIARPQEFYELCKKIHLKSERLREFVDNWSHERAGLIEHASFGNIEEFVPIDNMGDIHQEFLNQNRQRQVACSNCGLRCKNTVRFQDGGYSFIKCISWYTFMASCKIQDLSFSMECYNYCEKYGLDTLSTSRLIAFAIDLYRKDILTKQDTGGLHLEFGNPDLAFTMIKQIVMREGIGDVLADGIYEAARQIGNGAEKYAYHVKKLEAPIYSMNHPYVGYLQSVSDRADLLKMISAIPQHYLSKTKEVKKEYIESEYWPYPEEFKQFIWDDFDASGADYERITKMVSFDEDSNMLSDITGVCIYHTGFWPFNPYLFRDQIELINLATGTQIDEKEGMEIVQRAGMLTRAYNVRLGIDRKDDRPPEKHFLEPTEPPLFPPLDRDIFDKTISAHYELRGYDENGIPSADTLDNLGLNYIREDLTKRGILM